jgi:hypothetical protein
MSAGPFEDLPVIGVLSRDDAAAKLRELGEVAAADAVERAPPAPVKLGRASWWPFSDRAWQHTAHSIGFLLAGGSTGSQKILGIGEAQSDPSLKNARINIALNALRVADYPGSGTHREADNLFGVPSATKI